MLVDTGFKLHGHKGESFGPLLDQFKSINKYISLFYAILYTFLGSLKQLIFCFMTDCCHTH